MTNTGLFDPAPFLAESDTSRERAQREDRLGITQKRRQIALVLVNEAGLSGLTWKELADETGLHHGQVSAVLSTLHKAGLLFQLKDRREGSHPYLHGDFRNHFLDEEVNDEPAKTRASRDAEALENLVDAVRAFSVRGLGIGEILAALAELDKVRG